LERVREMPEQELSDDPVTLSEKASVEIRAVRQNLHRLCGQLTMTNDTAKEIARNELCKALVRRLEVAETEALELAEMIVLSRKSS
jgi:hypothetical protein